MQAFFISHCWDKATVDSDEVHISNVFTQLYIGLPQWHCAILVHKINYIRMTDKFSLLKSHVLLHLPNSSLLDFIGPLFHQIDLNSNGCLLIETFN